MTGNWNGAVSAIGQGVSNKEDADAQFKHQQQLAAEQNQYNVDMFNRQSDFNAQQQEKANQYNTSEREASQQWSEKMMDKQNEWNSPANQLRLLQEAGINPLSFDGSVADSASPNAADNPSTSGASSYAPSAGQGQAVMASPTDALVSAKAQNLKANTEKTVSETEGQNISNKYAEQLNQGLLKLQDAELQCNGAKLKVSEAEAENLAASTRVMKSSLDAMTQQIAESKARVDEIRASTDYQKIRTVREDIQKAFDVERVRAEILKDKAIAEYYHQNARTVDAQIRYLCNAASAQFWSAANQHFSYNVADNNRDKIITAVGKEADLTTFQAGQDMKYSDIERMNDVFSKSCSAIGSFLSGVGSVGTAFSIGKGLKGFGSTSMKNPNMFNQSISTGAPASWQGF